MQRFSRWTVTTSGAAAAAEQWWRSSAERPEAADNQTAELHAARAARGGGGLTSRWRREVGMVGENHGVERCPYAFLGVEINSTVPGGACDSGPKSKLGQAAFFRPMY
jgi:hypothetical protein